MVHVYISGFVQGIGFRQFVRHNARKIGVSGWVRNLSDGRVEAVFDGEEDKLKKIVDICRKGPFLSEVKNVEVDWELKTDEEFNEFNIR